MEIRMEVSKISKYRRLTIEDRTLIAQWKDNGLSNKKIAELLNRNISTIGRELKGNSFEGRLYEPLHAQYKADIKKRKAWEAKNPLKNAWVYSYVFDGLRMGWSPEQISGRLKLKYPDDENKHIGIETIYRFIYKDGTKALCLWEYLRRKQLRRRKKRGRKSHRVRIPDRVSIHDRPRRIEKRREAGHWEGDSIVGKGHANGLHSEYERVTSITKLIRLPRVDSKATILAQMGIFSSFPKEFRRSTTLDNGSEMAKHFLLRKALGMDTYFADPFSSYQRGGNENCNLWVRYYFPKKTDFSKVSDEEVADVEWELNNRPRKRLGFKTPMEKMNECLRGLR